MASEKQRPKRRASALTKERIVKAAIEILDADGETALTFRALAARLKTGSGAIYWHVADKHELLVAAAESVIVKALPAAVDDAEPRQVIRSVAIAVFDAIDAHPWIGAQLYREPWQAGLLEVYEAIGGGLLALKVPEHALFDAWSVVVNYILGVAGQNAANARLPPRETDRSTFLANFAARWEQFDPERRPFSRLVAKQLREHDDREQFLAGLDIILAGVKARR